MAVGERRPVVEDGFRGLGGAVVGGDLERGASFLVPGVHLTAII